MAEKRPGCPDWGYDGKERCYECHAPVNDRLMSCTKYEGPIAEAFEPCYVCGAPLFDWIGECPDCRGLVFEFRDKFACFNETIGHCDFKLTKEHLEEMDLFPMRIEVGNLLVGPVGVLVGIAPKEQSEPIFPHLAYSDRWQNPKHSYVMRIGRDESGEWAVIFDED